MIAFDASFRGCDLTLRGMGLPMPNCSAMRAGLNLPTRFSEIPNDFTADSFALEGLKLRFDYEYEQFNTPDAWDRQFTVRKHSLGLGLYDLRPIVSDVVSTQHTIELRPTLTQDHAGLGFDLAVESSDGLILKPFDNFGLGLNLHQTIPLYEGKNSPYELTLSIGLLGDTGPSFLDSKKVELETQMADIETLIKETLKKIEEAKASSDADAPAVDETRRESEEALAAAREALPLIRDNSKTLEGICNVNFLAKNLLKEAVKEFNDKKPDTKILLRAGAVWDPRLETGDFRAQVQKALELQEAESHAKLEGLKSPEDTLLELEKKLAEIQGRIKILNDSVRPSAAMLAFSSAMVHGVTAVYLNQLADASWGIPALRDKDLAMKLSLLNGFLNGGLASFSFQRGVAEMSRSLNQSRDTLWLTVPVAAIGGALLISGLTTDQDRLSEAGELLLSNGAYGAVTMGTFPANEDKLKRLGLGLAASALYAIIGAFTAGREGAQNNGWQRLGVAAGTMAFNLLDFLADDLSS